MRRIEHWIGGRHERGSRTSRGKVFNPATGEQTGEVSYAAGADVDLAVRQARDAFRAWRSVPLAQRAAILFRFRQLVEEHRTELAHAITAEHGKTISDASGEVVRGLETVNFACGVPHLLKGSFTEQASSGVDVYSIHQPLGVTVGVTPFNFPVMVPMWMFSNAIACGNCFILKPSEKDPSPSLLLAELWEKAGLPAGVFTVLQGDRETVQLLVEHRDTAAVSFVGSTPVARNVYELASRCGKRVQALGGAKNHMVVLPDANIDIAADAAVSAAFGSAGERCMAVAAVVAVGGIGDSLVAAIAERASTLKIGPGEDPESQMGPLVTAQHRERVASHLDAEALGGAQLVVDGRKACIQGTGFFLGASVVDRVQPGTRVYDEEVFGPVLCILRAETYEQAIDIVNRNPYGNGCAIFTRDGGAARRFQFDVSVGMVGINVPIPVPVAYYSFGGWKHSMFGDTDMYGAEGIRFYTRVKTVTARWPEPSGSSIDMGFASMS